jgi:acetylornithine deacetylase/succinyl-diaminopimelate desuccinylase-like protein
MTQPHTFNESIEIDEVVKCIKILLLTVRELLMMEIKE